MKVFAWVLIITALWMLPVTIVIVLMKPTPTEILVPVQYQKPQLMWLV
jgi:hypothetical protein